MKAHIKVVFKDDEFFPLVCRVSNTEADILSFVGGLLGRLRIKTREFEISTNFSLSRIVSWTLGVVGIRDRLLSDAPLVLHRPKATEEV